jgi:translocation protein SEC63
MGIALPSWIVEGKNSGYVLGLYGLLFGVCLPWAVGSWWYGSRRYTKDGVMTSSAGTFFRELKEETTLPELIAILSSASEFMDKSPVKPRLKNRKGLQKLEEQVKEALKERTGEVLEGRLYNKPATKRAALYVYAHLLRVPINDTSLLRGVHLFDLSLMI